MLPTGIGHVKHPVRDGVVVQPNERGGGILRHEANVFDQQGIVFGRNDQRPDFRIPHSHCKTQLRPGVGREREPQLFRQLGLGGYLMI